jgi:hypothetical protein
MFLRTGYGLNISVCVGAITHFPEQVEGTSKFTRTLRKLPSKNAQTTREGAKKASQSGLAKVAQQIAGESPDKPGWSVRCLAFVGLGLSKFLAPFFQTVCGGSMRLRSTFERDVARIDAAAGGSPQGVPCEGHGSDWHHGLGGPVRGTPEERVRVLRRTCPVSRLIVH